MKIVQVMLSNVDGKEVFTTWVDVKLGLKQGYIITLSDFMPEVKWKVDKVYTTIYKDAKDYSHGDCDEAILNDEPENSCDGCRNTMYRTNGGVVDE